MRRGVALAALQPGQCGSSAAGDVGEARTIVDAAVFDGFEIDSKPDESYATPAGMTGTPLTSVVGPS